MDQLQTIIDACREMRDLALEIKTAEENLAVKKAAHRAIAREVLPDLFFQAGISNIGLAAEGNMPAYNAVSEPYYRANIAADWAPEMKSAAFNWLVENGGKDLIKNVITIRLPMKSHKLQLAVTEALDNLGVEYTADVSVHSSSLTAFVKEQIERSQRTLPLDLLGADVGYIVRLKPQKGN